MAQATHELVTKKFVRVTGCRPGKFVEFDFAVGSPDLFVELILPEQAFAEFCQENGVVLLCEFSEKADENDMDWHLRDVLARIHVSGREVSSN